MTTETLPRGNRGPKNGQPQRNYTPRFERNDERPVERSTERRYGRASGRSTGRDYERRPEREYERKPTREFKPIVNGFTPFGLPQFLQEGLQYMSFEEPTDVQAQAIPVLMAGKDLIVQSQTGSGKTAAFAIPTLARLQRLSRELQALVIVPTRELALQVTSVFKSLAGPAVRITTIYGGAGMEGQVRGLRTGGYQVVVGTPGRLRDHLRRGTLQLNNLKMLVLDEADEMLDQGFAQDVEAIIEASGSSATRQTALFSATLPDWVMDTATKHLHPDYTQIRLDVNPESRPEIAHEVYDMTTADKTFALNHLLDTYKEYPMLVFVRTKFGVKKLETKLQDEGYSAAGLQGNLSQRAREQVMSAFRSGKIRILIATNVGARGIDVKGISHVINFDLPESTELFTHRIGRTGRNGASGTAITFLTRDDRDKWREIERKLADEGVEVKRAHWDGPKAEPGSAPAFVQPLPRTFGGGKPRRFDRQDSDNSFRARKPRSESFDFSGDYSEERPSRRFERDSFEERPNRNFEEREPRQQFARGGFDDRRPSRKFDDRQPSQKFGGESFEERQPSRKFDRDGFEERQPSRKFDRDGFSERPSRKFDDRPSFATSSYDEGKPSRKFDDKPSSRKSLKSGPESREQSQKVERGGRPDFDFQKPRRKRRAEGNNRNERW